MSISSPTRSSIKALGLFAVAITLFMIGCTSAPERLTFFITGDSRGYLEPCGCRRDQAGGLPGRQREIAVVPQKSRLVFDVGNMTAGTRDYEMLKMKYMLDGMAVIGYDAVNLGQKEAELDIEQLQTVLGRSKLPFVSANLVSAKTGEPITNRYRIVNKGKARIGVIGVTTIADEDRGPGIKVRPPLEALAEVIPEVDKQCDYLVVLAFANDEMIREIASKFHEVDAVFGGDVAQPSGSVQTINRASIFNVTDKGKVIARLDMARSGDTYRVDSAKAIKIKADKISASKGIGDLLASFKNELREKRYELASVEGMERIEATEGTANEFVGDKACVSCHADADTVWHKTGHAHAYATLVKAKSEYDPDCLRCHTVGYGLSSGFIDMAKTPNLANVQCENCHGRGKDHITSQSKTDLKPVTAATCIKCHDEENSENFIYAPFWKKIAH